MKINYYKKEKTDLIWWVDDPVTIGEHWFSFDRKKNYNLFRDYPYELSEEEIKTFDSENPYWAEFFSDRK